MEANKLVNQAKSTQWQLLIPPMNVENVVIAAVSDASHANVPNLGSQAGRLTVLAEKKISSGRGSACVLSWGSHRLRRVVRSTLAAEAMGLAESQEYAEFARLALVEWLCHALNIAKRNRFANRWVMLWVVDACSTFDLLGKDCGVPADKRLAIDVAALRELKLQINHGAGPVTPKEVEQMMPCGN